MDKDNGGPTLRVGRETCQKTRGSRTHPWLQSVAAPRLKTRLQANDPPRCGSAALCRSRRESLRPTSAASPSHRAALHLATRTFQASVLRMVVQGASALDVPSRGEQPGLTARAE